MNPTNFTANGITKSYQAKCPIWYVYLFTAPYCANPDAGFEPSLQLARQVGLPVIAWRTRQGFSTPAPKQPVLFPTTDTNIVGWIVCDEPSGLAPVTASITDANRLMREDPGCSAFFNLLPPNAQGNPDTNAVIAAAVRNGMRVISYPDCRSCATVSMGKNANCGFHPERISVQCGQGQVDRG